MEATGPLFEKEQQEGYKGGAVGATDDIEDRLRGKETERGGDGPTTAVCDETDDICNEERPEEATTVCDDREDVFNQDGPEHATTLCDETEDILYEDRPQWSTTLSDDDDFCGVRLRSHQQLAVRR